MKKTHTINTLLSRFILLIIATFIAGQSMAQDFPIEPPSPVTKVPVTADTDRGWQGMYLNPVAGIGLIRPTGGSVDFVNHGGFGSASYSGALNFNAGAEVCLMLTPNFGVSLGLLFEQSTYSFKYNNISDSGAYNGTTTSPAGPGKDSTVVAGYTSSATYTIEDLKVPLLVRYISGPQNRVNLYVEAGITANILIGNKVSGNATEVLYNLREQPNVGFYDYHDAANNTVTINESDADFAKINFNLHLGVGLTIPLSPGISLVAEYSPEFGLMNCGTGKNDMVNFGDTQFYFFGSGKYGSLNTEAGSIKLLFKI